MKGSLILLADSQLLFARPHAVAFGAQLRAAVRGRRGVYVGAANGDQAAFFELAQAALAAMGATLVWQRTSTTTLTPHYDFYLLAGGDVLQGWRYLSQPSIRSSLEQAHVQGALMLGVSAGAIHLASAMAGESGVGKRFLGFCDAAVAVHEEREHWPTYQHWARMPAPRSALICIPMGGAVICAPTDDYSVGTGVKWWRQDGSERVLNPLPPDFLMLNERGVLTPASEDGRWDAEKAGGWHND